MSPRFAALVALLFTASAFAQAADAGVPPLPAEVSLWVGEERVYAAPPGTTRYSASTFVELRPEADNNTLGLMGGLPGATTVIGFGKKGTSVEVHVYSLWVLASAQPVPSPGATVELELGEALALRVGPPLSLQVTNCKSVEARALSYGLWVLEATRPGRCAVTLTGVEQARTFEVEVRRAPDQRAKRVVMRKRQLHLGQAVPLHCVPTDVLPPAPSVGAVDARLLGDELLATGTRAGSTEVQVRLENGQTLVFPLDVVP